MKIATAEDFNNALNFFAPYGLIGYTKDGGCLCAQCLRNERASIQESIEDGNNDGWLVVAIESGDIDPRNPVRPLLQGCIGIRRITVTTNKTIQQKGSSMLKVSTTYNEYGEIGNLREQVRVLREALERVNRECNATPHEDPHLCYTYDSVTAATVVAVRAALEAIKEA